MLRFTFFEFSLRLLNLFLQGFECGVILTKYWILAISFSLYQTIIIFLAFENPKSLLHLDLFKCWMPYVKHLSLLTSILFNKLVLFSHTRGELNGSFGLLVSHSTVHHPLLWSGLKYLNCEWNLVIIYGLFGRVCPNFFSSTIIMSVWGFLLNISTTIWHTHPHCSPQNEL